MITEKERLYFKEYRQKNKERIRKIAAQYYSLNKDRIRLRHRTSDRKRALLLSEKIRRRLNVMKYRQRTVNLKVSDIQTVYENNIKRFGQLTCELCYKTLIFGEDSLEHFHPVSRASEYPEDVNSIKNLGVAHYKCNSIKNNRTLDEWRQNEQSLSFMFICF